MRRSAHAADTAYQPPASPRITYDMNPNWRFIKQDADGAEAPGFDDSSWAVVSTPHTYNDVDTFNKIISHSGGQAGEYQGPAWYRRHFSLPVDVKGRHVYVEFEGMRQAGDIYLNGKNVGLYENGITAYGIDMTHSVNIPGDNVLAVRVDNGNYNEKSSGQGFEWESKDFNPNYGGINRHVWLHVTGPIHQTLPLNYGLQTSGVYIYPTNIDVNAKTAEINVESQVANESGDNSPVTLSVIVVDTTGKQVAKFEGDTVDMVNGEKTIHKAAGKATGLHFWSPDDPALYDVYTILTADNKVVDVMKTRTGFRKVEFRGGVGKGGVFINGKFCYLKGYSQRSSDEWAGLGQAYPDWMHDYTGKLIRDSHANYVRWMHISPQKTDVESYDKYGIVEVCPAGDKEKDVKGRQWEQRVEVMRDSIIYYRNNPSILFWEAGNNGVSAEHMKEMVALKEELDPSGCRAMGCRSLTEPGTTEAAEYYGVMIGQDDAKDTKRKTPEDMFRAYSDQRRDRAPLIETEDFRDEGARRFWDDFSPPHFGFKKGKDDTYEYTSETFALAQVDRYWDYFSHNISNTNPKMSKWSGYASIYFSDSNADGRQDSSEVCRVSGKVDAVRLPKEIYFAERVMQNPAPDIHILGHWTYPKGTRKSMYVISNCGQVELVLNGKTIGTVTKPTNGYVFEFPNVSFEPGTLKAIGFDHGKQLCEETLNTAGAPAAIKLTPITGPGGFLADGADVALFDVEVVDAHGERCPTDEARVDFEVKGPGIWRGGYNSGIVGSNNNLYLLTECGINRVSIRSTLKPGTITLTATRTGLKPATMQVNSIATSGDSNLLTPAGVRRGLPSPSTSLSLSASKE